MSKPCSSPYTTGLGDDTVQFIVRGGLQTEYTAFAVIEELWKKLRGIDDWPETEAEVTGVFQFEGRRNSKNAVVSFRYKDESGRYHAGQFRGDIYSSIYHISMGDMISVKYDPARPERYWSDEAGLPVQTPLFLWSVIATALLLYVLIASRK